MVIINLVSKLQTFCREGKLMEVQIFDKSKYEGPVPDDIAEAIGRLAALGEAIVAVRGNRSSANLKGVISIGKDGDDPVLSVGECGCHVHVEWDQLAGFIPGREDVGHGVAESVLYLVDVEGEPVVRLFYPQKTYEEIVEFVIRSMSFRIELRNRKLRNGRG